MERKTTKKVVEPRDRGLFREVTIELIQHYNDSTKKLVKTEEGSRTEGRLYRAAKAGEKYDTQLMDSETYDVLSLVEVLHDTGTQDYAPEAAAKPEKPKKAKAAPAPAPAPVSTDEGQEEEQKDDSKEDDSNGADDAAAAQAEASEQEATEDSDEGSENEDDMATKKKSKAKTKTPTKTKTGSRAAKAKAPKAPKAPKAAKAASDKPSSGQSGPTVDLNKKKINPKEQKILAALNHGKGPQKIAELAAEAFGNKPSQAKANSWVRNSLRRLVRGGLVEQAARGTYKLTAKGKNYDPKKVAKAVEDAKAA